MFSRKKRSRLERFKKKHTIFLEKKIRYLRDTPKNKIQSMHDSMILNSSNNKRLYFFFIDANAIFFLFVSILNIVFLGA